MHRSKAERQLPPPPAARARRELPAVIEPALRDVPDAPDFEVEERFEVFESERLQQEPLDSLLNRAREVALGDDRARRVLGEGRVAVLGLSQCLDDKENGDISTLLLAYRYSDHSAIEIWLAGGPADLRVEEVREAAYQPPPSDDELREAAAIAGKDARVADAADRDGWETTAILTSDVDPGDRHYGRRRVVVGFGPADERQPRVRALVDLGAERVLAVDTRQADEEEAGE